MNNFIVHYEKVISYDVYVKANSEEQAKELTDRGLLDGETVSEISDIDKQEGYIEYCYTDLDEDESKEE